MDSRPTVFIGSSTEGLIVANALKSAFGDLARVELWNAGQVFSRNQSFFKSLLDASSLFDFAILVFTADDQTLIRDDLHEVARDNVLFEFGLFLGRQGPRRAVALVQDKLRVPTDFSGIHFDRFSLWPATDAAPPDNFTAVAKRIVDDIVRYHANTAEFNHLPSTALAIGYFSNFIEKVCSELIRLQPVTIGDKSITFQDFSLTILMPDDLWLVHNKNFASVLRGLTQVKVTSSVFREFPFYVQAAPTDGVAVLELFDIPTTLSSSKQAVEKIFREEYVGKGDLQRKAEEREIMNFEKTLRLLLAEHPFWRSRVHFRSLAGHLSLK